MADFLRESIIRKNGQLVNARTILKHPAVWRGVDLISTSLAKIPFSVYERESDGRREADEHDAYAVLKRPNDIYSRFQLMKCWVVNTLTHGDGFIWIQQDEFGRPMGLYLLDSGQTSIHSSQFGVHYTTTDKDGVRHRLDSSEVLHLRGLGNDGICGLKIANVLCEAFGLGLTLQDYQNLFFENAGRPSVVIKLPETVTTLEQAEEFREAWDNVHGGPANAFKPALMMPGADVSVLPNDSAIESLANLREHDLVTIANCLGIVPHRIGAKSVSVSYGSLEQENLSFLQDIDGWITQGEQEMSLKLLRPSEQVSHYIEGTREALVQSDSKTKAELLALYRRNGMMSDEQIARKMNVKRDSGGTYWTEANLIERSKALAADSGSGSEGSRRDAEPAEEMQDDRELAMKLTRSTVARLYRRAVKSQKIELALWKEELGHLPGFKEFTPDMRWTTQEENAPIEQSDIDEITEMLWKTD